MAALLEIDDLRVSVGDREILSSITFEVERGQAMGMVGETGSGKTLTCRAITGTLARIGGRVSGGRLLFDEQGLLDLAPRARDALKGRRISFIPQSSMVGLDPVMTIGRQVKETIHVLESGADATARATDLLRAVQLQDPETVLRAYPHQLSGGMRQRVMIALALAGNPDLVVADEPTTALDVTVQREILELLSRLRQERQLAMILVTHDLSLVEDVCETIAVVYAGMTVESGPTATVLSKPRHPYTKALLSARLADVDPGSRLPSLPGAPPLPGAWPPGCRFAPRCPLAIDQCDAELPALERHGLDSRAACIRSEGV